MVNTRYEAAIKEAADRYDLDEALIYGICMTESSCSPSSMRFEGQYRWLYHPETFVRGTNTLQVETTWQKTSIGLMQVMGAVYRELGYKGESLSTKPLHDINLQLAYGCLHLKKLIERHGLEPGIAAYNAGVPRLTEDRKFVNQDYVDKVLKHAQLWRDYKCQTKKPL